MIRAFENRTAPLEASARAAAHPRDARGGGSDFLALFASGGAQPAPAAAPQKRVETQTGAAAAPPAPAAETAPPAAELPAPFSPAAVEQHMNEWLIGVLRHQNDVKMLLYENAVAGWNNVNARNRELGLPEVPRPEPPELAALEPMPPGWWFQVSA